MADTMQTIAAALAQLPLNTSGAIGPQDVRDIVETLRVRGGSMYVSTAIETVISTIDTPTKALGTTTLVTPAYDFTMPADNRMRYDGVADVLATVQCGISITAAANSQDTTMHIAKNGTVITSSAAQRKIGTGADVGRAAVGAQLVLTTNDYVEVWLENNTGTANITVENLTMNILAFAV